MQQPGGPADEGRLSQLRSKGLMPAVGVGAAVYFVTGLVSLSTIGLVGLGAGVGYGVGSWLAEAYQKKQDGSNSDPQGVPIEQLPWAMQVSLQQWQTFLAARVTGPQLDPAQVEGIFKEFESVEPAHATNVRNLVMTGAGQYAEPSASTVKVAPGVHVVPTTPAAEV
mmetsp:Transcript_117800/g.229064  ORF Transcript_117800/g.229064 Transcript_117800/m.229064 type:complete len:167 (-) Transcript_117800:86-586(-)|eukprot:CAMPEP_0172769800 /NCGR_PEP_ID=MMETSP1074-20121228/187303_1 /TAXON_ID=2916 /ORGANISM="Ceratium fusus, Strain PA161109" /LENGTH=166 /DNA_ID=CAMNT_0013605437 /DNA_START=51 /DNA_END=551 /DNA_ORIENTATION=-